MKLLLSIFFFFLLTLVAMIIGSKYFHTGFSLVSDTNRNLSLSNGSSILDQNNINTTFDSGENRFKIEKKGIVDYVKFLDTDNDKTVCQKLDDSLITIKKPEEQNIARNNKIERLIRCLESLFNQFNNDLVRLSKQSQENKTQYIWSVLENECPENNELRGFLQDFMFLNQIESCLNNFTGAQMEITDMYKQKQLQQKCIALKFNKILERHCNINNYSYNQGKPKEDGSVIHEDRVGQKRDYLVLNKHQNVSINKITDSPGRENFSKPELSITTHSQNATDWDSRSGDHFLDAFLATPTIHVVDLNETESSSSFQPTPTTTFRHKTDLNITRSRSLLNSTPITFSGYQNYLNSNNNKPTSKYRSTTFSTPKNHSNKTIFYPESSSKSITSSSPQTYSNVGKKSIESKSVPNITSSSLTDSNSKIHSPAPNSSLMNFSDDEIYFKEDTAFLKPSSILTTTSSPQTDPSFRMHQYTLNSKPSPFYDSEIVLNKKDVPYFLNPRQNMLFHGLGTNKSSQFTTQFDQSSTTPSIKTASKSSQTNSYLVTKGSKARENILVYTNASPWSESKSSDISGKQDDNSVSNERRVIFVTKSFSEDFQAHKTHLDQIGSSIDNHRNKSIYEFKNMVIDFVDSIHDKIEGHKTRGIITEDVMIILYPKYDSDYLNNSFYQKLTLFQLEKEKKNLKSIEIIFKRLKTWVSKPTLMDSDNNALDILDRFQLYPTVEFKKLNVYEVSKILNTIGEIEDIFVDLKFGEDKQPPKTPFMLKYMAACKSLKDPTNFVLAEFLSIYKEAAKLTNVKNHKAEERRSNSKLKLEILLESFLISSVQNLNQVPEFARQICKIGTKNKDHNEPEILPVPQRLSINVGGKAVFGFARNKFKSAHSTNAPIKITTSLPIVSNTSLIKNTTTSSIVSDLSGTSRNSDINSGTLKIEGDFEHNFLKITNQTVNPSENTSKSLNFSDQIIEFEKIMEYFLNSSDEFRNAFKYSFSIICSKFENS